MKPDTNLSRRSSIFYCNRHELIGHPWSTSVLPHRKHLGNFEEGKRQLYFSNEPTRPAGDAKTIKKRIIIPLHVSSILKSVVILVIWLALIGAIYSQEAPPPTQWNWKTTFAALWRPAPYWIKKSFLQTKKSCIWGTKFCHFKMVEIKWCLNLVSYNNTCDFISNSCCTHFWFWTHSYAHMISDLITHVIMSRKFCRAERSRGCTHTCGTFEYTRLFADLCDFTVTMHHPTKIISYCNIGWLGIFTGKFSGEDVFD